MQKIGLPGQDTDRCIFIQDYKLNIPCKKVRNRNNNSIYNDMDAVQALLIISDHKPFPISKSAGHTGGSHTR